MFENIIEQSSVLQLRDDILNNRNAQSMLFFGPSYSGKGSAALEFARALSCLEKGEWKCTCLSCKQHRYLQHEDLLALGTRSFSTEISACSSSFLRNTENQNARLLLLRSFRKLMLRFSPVLMEDNQKLAKTANVCKSLDEKLNEFLDSEEMDKAAYEKLCNLMIKDAHTLENDGLGHTIPIGHIRSASYWCRLSPSGKRKTLIIENAENMRDESRNSLLKILEEPPDSVNIVLTAHSRESIMPTILSRLRPYRFLKRTKENEKEVIRRVFLDNKDMSLSEYLDSFMHQSTEKMYPVAAWFIVSLARIAAMSVKKRGDGNIPSFVNLLGERYSKAAETSGLVRCLNSASVIKTLNKNFEEASFPRFMKICLDLISEAARSSADPQCIEYNDVFRKHINETVTAVDVFNINTTIALEALFFKLKTSLIRR